MADENISIELTDKVNLSIQTKLRAIADNARDAHSSVTQLQQSLNSLSPGGLNAVTTGTKQEASAASDAAKATQALTAALQTATAAAQRSAGAMDAAASQAAELAGAANNAATNLNKIGKGFDDLGGGAKRALTPTIDVVNAAKLAADTIIAMGKAMIEASDQVSSLQSRLKLVSSTTASADAAFQELFKIAQQSRTGFIELGGTYQQLARSTQQLGISQKDTLRITDTIAKSLTISGVSASSAQAALVQLSQGFASGTLRGEELNSVLEQTPRLAQAIADGLGVPVGKLRELGSQGELTAEKVSAALLKSANAVDSEFGNMSETVGQSFTKMTNAATVFWSELDKAIGVSTAVRTGVNLITSAMEALIDVTRTYNRELAERNRLEKAGQAAAVGTFGETGGGAAFGGLRARRVGAQTNGQTFQQSDLFNAINNATGNAQTQADATATDFIDKFRGKTKLGDLQNDLKKLSDEYAKVKASATDAGEAEKVYMQAVQERIEQYQKADKAADKRASNSAESAAKKAAREALKQQEIQQGLTDTINKADAKDIKLQQDRANAVTAYTEALEASNLARQQALDTQVAMLSMSDQERQNYQNLINVQTEYQKKLDELTKQRTTNKITESQFSEEKAALQKWYDDRVAMEENANQRIAEARQNWQVGATRALAQYQQQAMNVADTFGSALTNALNKTEDAFVQLMTTGKFSFKDFANSIIADFARIQAKQAVSGIASLIAKGIGSYYGGGTDTGTAGVSQTSPVVLDNGTAGTPLFASGGYTGNGGKDEPAGIVHGREFVFDAAATAYYGADNLDRMMRAAGSGNATAASGSGGAMGGTPNVSVVVINNGGEQMQASSKVNKDDQGNLNIEVMLDQIESGLANRVASGRGPLNKSIQNGFNVRPTPNSRG